MFSRQSVSADQFRDKELCLTFDDGPGEPNYSIGGGCSGLHIAKFLKILNIPAVFFIVGKFASQQPDFIRSILDLGHQVGNHTWNHFNLTDLSSHSRLICDEISCTSGLIDQIQFLSPILFRPPYGAWTQELAEHLNAGVADAERYIGPICWDIDGYDWKCWLDHRPVEECAAQYMREIATFRKGIILMHDCCADIPAANLQFRTFELLQYLIPNLIEQGYTFRPLMFS